MPKIREDLTKGSIGAVGGWGGAETDMSKEVLANGANYLLNDVQMMFPVLVMLMSSEGVLVLCVLSLTVQLQVCLVSAIAPWTLVFFCFFFSFAKV